MKKISDTLIKMALLAMFCFSANAGFSQYRPSLFFREDFKETPAAYPITQSHIANPDLIMGIYGPGCDSIKKSHHEKPIDDPITFGLVFARETGPSHSKTKKHMLI
jgi:hypothetical protein